MTLLTKHSFSKDLDRIRSISSKIDQKLSDINTPDNTIIDKLTVDELQDLKKIVGIADFMMCKYEDKKAPSELKELIARQVLLRI